MKTTDPPICTNCRYFYWLGERCFSDNNPMSLVTGSRSGHAPTLRADPARCGPEGKWFAPRPTERKWWQIFRSE